MQRQNDNIAPGALTGEDRSLALTREVNLRHTLIRHLSTGNQRIREVIQDLDGRRKEALFIGVWTGKGYLKCQGVLVSATSIFWDKVMCMNSGFTFQNFYETK